MQPFAAWMGVQIIRRFVMLEVHKKTFQAFANVFGQGWPGDAWDEGTLDWSLGMM